MIREREREEDGSGKGDLRVRRKVGEVPRGFVVGIYLWGLRSFLQNGRGRKYLVP